MQHVRRILTLIVAALLTVGCGAAARTNDAPTAPPTTEPVLQVKQIPTPTGLPPATGGGPATAPDTLA